MKIQLERIAPIWLWKKLIAFAIITLLTAALYVPFLSNAIVFDDNNLYTNLSIFDYATTPFSLAPRAFPYFTLGFTEVTWKSIEAHRIFSLILHILNALLVFRLIERWLKDIGKTSADKALSIALITSLCFAIHPVAVYGAGYLIQRTMLFATFFSLLSLWFYWRGLSQNRMTDSITAALFYALAIFSKENAIMLPATVLLVTVLHDAPWRSNLAKIGTYLLFSIPPAIFVVLAVKGVIGTAYEPDVTTFISAMPAIETNQSQWLLSAVTQCGLFFRYLSSWLFPDLRLLAADIRIDLLAQWTPFWIVFKPVAFLALSLAATRLLVRKGRLGLIGWGLLYLSLMFATELASIRFQEPFVLYRSYLWAPGLLAVLAGMLAQTDLVTRYLLPLFAALILPLLFVLSHDRLQSLEDEYALWHDAANKLAAPDLPGSERIYYNLGIQRIKRNQPEAALVEMNHVVSLIPHSHEGYIGRGKAYQNLERDQEAVADFETAEKYTTNGPLIGMIEYSKFLSLARQKHYDEAKRALSLAAQHGNQAAKALMNSEGNRWSATPN